MKILFLTPCVPSPSDGRRPFNFIRYLVPNHEVHLLAMRLPVQTPSVIRPLLEWGVHLTTIDYNPLQSYSACLNGLLRGRSMRVSWCRSQEFQFAVEKKLDCVRFDLVHIDRLRMGQYAPLISLPKVLDLTDSLVLYFERCLKYHRSWKDRFVDRWELKATPQFERIVLPQVNAAIVCSALDAQIYKRYHPQFEFEVIENGVDARLFIPRTHGSAHIPRCILTGTLFYYPNIDAVRFYSDEILPKIHRKFPELESIIIGTRPKPEVLRYDGRMGIRILADVPRMEEYLCQDDIYLCPLRIATGVRNKLLEAMSAGMPIITTQLGAEGLNLHHEQEVLFAETPDQYVDQLERLFNSPELQKSLGRNARKYVLEHHDFDGIGDKLKRLYQRLL